MVQQVLKTDTDIRLAAYVKIFRSMHTSHAGARLLEFSIDKEPTGIETLPVYKKLWFGVSVWVLLFSAIVSVFPCTTEMWDIIKANTVKIIVKMVLTTTL